MEMFAQHLQLEGGKHSAVKPTTWKENNTCVWGVLYGAYGRETVHGSSVKVLMGGENIGRHAAVAWNIHSLPFDGKIKFGVERGQRPVDTTSLFVCVSLTTTLFLLH